MDVLLQRRRVAVVELQAGRLGRELVDELVPRADDLEDAVHVRRVDAVKVNRVRVRAGVDEAHAEDVVLGRADDRPRHGAVVRPGREEDSRRDLDLAVDRAQRVLADASRLVRQHLGRIQQGVEVVRPADGGRVAADHGRVAHRRVAAHVTLQRALRGFRIAVESQLAEHRRGHDRSSAGEQPSACKFSHD